MPLSLVFLACSFFVVSRGYSATPNPNKVFSLARSSWLKWCVKMGCHRRLLFCSPAKSLGLRVCHSFWVFFVCMHCSFRSYSHKAYSNPTSIQVYGSQAYSFLTLCSAVSVISYPWKSSVFENQKLRQTLVLSAEVAGCPILVHFLLPPSLNSQSARYVPFSQSPLLSIWHSLHLLPTLKEADEDFYNC